MATEATGIVQSDLLIRAAVMEAIRDLRANDYLLDYVFASLPQDPLTAQEFGDAEVRRAKEWFLNTEVKVYLNVNINTVQFPCITIALASSTEEETTLGDTHYEPREQTDRDWPIYAGPLTPEDYDLESGRMVLREQDVGSMVLAAGMLVVDRAGNTYPIVEVPDFSAVVRIAPNVSADFTDMTVRPARPAYITAIESASYKEIYSMGCHVDSEAVHATYLHSILVFALLRYKETLLEGRGYERTSLSSSDLRRDEEALPEQVYSRYTQVTGYVRQAWPKVTSPKVAAVLVQPLPDALEGLSEESIQEALDEDMLSFKLKP